MSKKSLALLVLALVSGCNKEPTSSTTDTAPDLTNPEKTPGATPDGDPLDCLGLFTCAGECESDACVQECIDTTSDDGVAQAGALAQCSQDHACDSAEESCLEDNCADELAACAGESPSEPGGGDDPFPARISGTTLDSTTFGGVGIESSAEVVFVRDDAAGAEAGYPTESVAFYRVESIDYHVSTTGACTDSADRSATDPDPFESNLLIEREAVASGGYKYGMAIGLADGRTATCNTSIEHYVSTDNTNQPETDLTTFTGSWISGSRERSWDLQAE